MTELDQLQLDDDLKPRIFKRRLPITNYLSHAPYKWWELYWRQEYLIATSFKRPKNSEENEAAANAHRMCQKAVLSGELIPLQECELCQARGDTQGHHWAGYDHPLFVWWVCANCNRDLRYIHDGSLLHPVEGSAFCRWVKQIRKYDSIRKDKEQFDRLLSIGYKAYSIEIANRKCGT